MMRPVFYLYDNSLQLNITRELRAREAEIEIATRQNLAGAQTAVIFVGSRRPFTEPENICNKTTENRDVAVFERWFRTHGSDGVIRFATHEVRYSGLQKACSIMCVLCGVFLFFFCTIFRDSVDTILSST